MCWCDTAVWYMKAVGPAVVILAKLNIQVANATLYRCLMNMSHTHKHLRRIRNKILYTLCFFLRK
jgi:hypothetical protein